MRLIRLVVKCAAGAIRPERVAAFPPEGPGSLRDLSGGSPLSGNRRSRGTVVAMPLIQISQTPGLSDRVKRETIAAVTEAYARATGKNPDSVWVTITEVPRSHWGVGGEPLGQ